MRHNADEAKSALDGVAREKVRFMSNTFVYLHVLILMLKELKPYASLIF